MDKVEFLKFLNFPTIWEKANLLPDSYFELAKVEFEKEYGDTKPVGGTEHWRFGSFIFLLKADLNTSEIEMLVEAAIEDPDKPMAGGVIEELLSKELATNAILEKACTAIESNKYYYKSTDQLRNAFESGVGPYAVKP